MRKLFAPIIESLDGVASIESVGKTHISSTPAELTQIQHY